MAKKYYAVKKGHIPGVYQTWDDTKKQVNGFSGAVYKSFPTLEEAEEFLSDNLGQTNYTEKDIVNSTKMNEDIDEKIQSLSEDEVIAFVDGSYNNDVKRAGFGAIIISKGGNKSTSYKSFGENLGEEFITLRNVAAELEGVKEAVEIAVSSHKKKITLYYDYTGIEKWAIGEWSANKTLTRKYVEYMKEKMSLIEIEFIKVPAHSNIKYNEEADKLAKESLLAKGHKTYKDGSVYFVGYSAADWDCIVSYINEENNKSLENDNTEIKIVKKDISDTRKQLNITDSKDRVSINLYNNNKSYVQGKQSVLFQKLISTAIEFLTSDQKVVETLNSYHALNITKEEVEVYFEKILPNYNGNYKDKIYVNLLSATYNIMLTGYMPDYTCLVTPVFRGFEYCLHKILGEKMGLETANDNGKNNFSYFSKGDDGRYECNNSAKNSLTNKQMELLNELYNDYNKVRHIYSHWSADDYDTAMIDNLSKAREILENGLILINEYYKLF